MKMVLCTLAFALTCLAAGARAAEPAGTIVLDTYGVWRMHFQIEPPVLWNGDQVHFGYEWLNYRTAAAPDDWAQPEFDDENWCRGPVTLALESALGARLCLRGKFTVTDPGAVRGLRLSAAYRGGIIVYVNGVEVHRDHLADGAALADGPGGEERALSDLPIPEGRLRPGLNVIGIEIARAPYPETGGEPGEDVYDLNTCEITRARLTADDPSGLVPNASRPAGRQVWNADTMATDLNLDFGDQAEPLRPVRIVGARNGLFSGKFVLGSTEPIRGLRVTPGDLEGPGGRISASAVRVRYGVAWGDEELYDGGRLRPYSPYPTWTTQLSALAERPLDEFPVLPPVRTGEWVRHPAAEPGQPPVVPGAVVPVWLTVNVPRDAGAGTYAGTVAVEAQGEEPVRVEVEVRVADWALPDPDDYVTWVEIIEHPDTLALEYGVPLWSDRHFEMIGNALRLIGRTGSRVLYIPLLAHTNVGGEQSMVRWVKKGDGYDYDFSVMERYLDVALANMGRPKLVVFVAWDYYMIPADTSSRENERFRQKYVTENLDRIGAQYGFGPMVTLLDPDTGASGVLELPHHSDAAASRALWQPLFDELHRRMAARGLEGTMMLGLEGDGWPGKEDVALLNEVSGGLPWAMHSHNGHSFETLQFGIARIAYQARVWTCRFSDGGADAGKPGGTMESLRGWDGKDLNAQFDRINRDDLPCSQWRQYAETVITGTQRGPGRLGGDFWKVIRNKRGERAGRAYERFPESNWRNLIIQTSVLGPGPDGPVATNHLEAFREGVQECEARIQIERALGDAALRARLGPDLADRCEQYLRRRHIMMWLSLSNLQCYYDSPTANWRRWMAKGWRGWATSPVSGHLLFLCSGWQERSYQLFSLAGEVARALEDGQ
jgi:hypothetical protein